MKNQVVVLAVLIAYISCADVEPQAVEPVELSHQIAPLSITGRSLISGILSPSDKLLHRGVYTKVAGAATAVQTQDVVYRSATTTTRITYIAAIAIGGTHTATAQITAGGINTNNVTIRLTSASGAGFEFWVQIWGR